MNLLLDIFLFCVVLLIGCIMGYTYRTLKYPRTHLRWAIVELRDSDKPDPFKILALVRTYPEAMRILHLSKSPDQKPGCRIFLVEGIEDKVEQFIKATPEDSRYPDSFAY